MRTGTADAVLFLSAKYFLEKCKKHIDRAIDRVYNVDK